MTGLMRDPRTIEVDDETLAILMRTGSAYVRDSHGDLHIGAVVHDGASYLVRLETDIAPDAKRLVEVRPRTAQGARQ